MAAAPPPPPPPVFDLRELFEDAGGRTWQRADQGNRYGGRRAWRWKVRLARLHKRLNMPGLINPAARPVPDAEYQIWSTRRGNGGANAGEWLKLRVDRLEGWGARRKRGWVYAVLVASSARR